MKLIKLCVLIGVAATILWGIYNLFQERQTLNAELNKLTSELQKLETENKELTAKIEYFKTPGNLLKEVKSQFNYRALGEKLMIIVPSGTSTKKSD